MLRGRGADGPGDLEVGARAAGVSVVDLGAAVVAAGAATAAVVLVEGCAVFAVASGAAAALFALAGGGGDKLGGAKTG